MSKTVKWILVGAGIFILLFVVAKVMSGKDEGLKVSAEAVKRSTVIETVNASGKIFPELEVRVGAGLTGEISELLVQEGDTVKKDQVLARILSESSRSSAPRISGGDYTSILQSLQNPPPPSRGTSTVYVKAPISGIVSMLNVKKGERVGGMSSAELMRIADLSRMEVRVDVNENDIIKVSVNDSADIEVEAYSKKKFKGIVTRIANTTNKKDGAASFLSNDITSYEVHILIDPSSYMDLIDPAKPRRFPFRPGMNARADIKTNTKANVLVVPVASVASRAKGSDENLDEKKKERKKEADEMEEPVVASDELEEIVFVINKDNVVERKVVTTGIQDINNIEILSGLQEGEKVVTGPYNLVSRTLRNGKKVKVVKRTELFEK